MGGVTVDHCQLGGWWGSFTDDDAWCLIVPTMTGCFGPFHLDIVAFLPLYIYTSKWSAWNVEIAINITDIYSTITITMFHYPPSRGPS